MTRIAVYGTLRSDVREEREWYGASPLEDFARPLGPCKIRGLLFDVGPFPALRFGEGVVTGQLWEVFAGCEEWAFGILDRIESYDPHWEKDSQYLRREVTLIDPEVTAHVYVWNCGMERLRLLPRGDWAEEVRERYRLYQERLA